jgi:hypothetical protein
MPSKSFARWKEYLTWQFCLAILFSLVLHIVAFDGLDFLSLPDVEPMSDNIEARIVMPKPVAQAAAKPARKMEQPRPAPPPEVLTPPPEPVIEPAAELPNPVEEMPEPIPEISVTPEPVAEEAVTESRPLVASYIESDFELRRRTDNSTEAGTVGIAHISYKTDTEGRYSIISVAEAKGLVSLFLSGKLRQESQGRVTAKGLQPERFVYQYGGDEAKAQRATFDWSAGTLAMESAKGKNTVPLVAGTQDLLSFMYQFMFTPPLQEMKLSVTNGKRLRTYDYSFEGEERIATKMGEFSTLRIAKSSADGKDRTDVWLAMDYHYIPVKIRKTEENGTVIEQIVTRFSTDILK